MFCLTEWQRKLILGPDGGWPVDVIFGNSYLDIEPSPGQAIVAGVVTSIQLESN